MEWIKQNKGFLVLITLSIFWMIGAIWLLFSELIKEDFYPKGMPLNELGDYLAGAFSPLAFGWLVYGYFMQNRELKNQLTEFKNNVEIQKRSYIDKYRSLQPILHIEGTFISKTSTGTNKYGNQIYEEGDTFNIRISNSGNEIKEIKIKSEKDTLSSTLKSLTSENSSLLQTKISKKEKQKWIDTESINLSKEYSQKKYKRSENTYITYLDKDKRLLTQKIDFFLYEKDYGANDVRYELEALLSSEIKSNEY